MDLYKKLSDWFAQNELEGIEVGELYRIQAVHKEYLFTSQVISVNDEIAELEIIAQN